MSNFNVTESINVLFEKLENFFKTKTVVGEPITVGDATIIPFISITFGLGSGGGDGTDEKGSKGIGGGAGTSGRIAPTAVLVIRGEQIDLLPMKKSGGLDKLLDMVPGIVEKVKDSKCCEE